MNKYIRSIVKIFQQCFIHYNELDELRKVENKFVLKCYRNFVQEFINEQNFKECNIINSLNVIKKSFDNLIIIENNETENRYQADNDEEYISRF